MEINDYITHRYKNWLDSARFRCRVAGIPDEAEDVLQEVLCSLLQKNPDILSGLISRRKDGYTELDWFVLRMIELNATSPTSPYRHKTRRGPVDQGADLLRLEIADLPDEEEDRAGRILWEMNRVRDVFATLELSESSRKIFAFRFFQGEDFVDWCGPESQKYLYDTYNRIITIIRAKIRKVYI